VVNVYTRREEMRWTIIALVVLVLSTAGSVVRLVTAQGKVIPDPASAAAAKAAETRVGQAKSCLKAAEQLNTELPVLKSSAKAVRMDKPDAGATLRGRKPPPPPKDNEILEIAWPVARPSHKEAKNLVAGQCRALVEGVTGAKPDAGKGWDAIIAASAISPGEDYKSQVEAARKLFAALAEAPIDKVLEATKEAEASLKKVSDAETEKAKNASVREPLPKGLLQRELAVGLGVLLGVITLLVSFLSVRAAATRRVATLLPLREAAKTGNTGAQAATILTLAAQHSGGEPGLVMGAGLGGLAAAVLIPVDADVFVAGVMVGLLLGLGLQWTFRLALGLSNWRRRATELADIEKPAIPIVLVLQTVNVGLEGQFWSFFSNLPPAEQAATVARLASQAEEQILAAADAGAAAAEGGMPQQQHPGHFPPGGSYPSGGMPPGR
jgi:hypothetical protein